MELVIQGGTLIDGTGTEPRAGHGLVIRDGTIAAVGPDDALDHGRDAVRLDVEGRTILPGLIDCHTHLTYHTRALDLWQQELQESVELNTLKAMRNAEAILHMGFTAIGDGGCRGLIGPAIRDGIEQGVIRGPRVVPTGPILCGTAGLQDNMPPWMQHESDAALGMEVNGPSEVRRAVRRQIKGGVDWIKVSASGVAGSRYSTAETDDLTVEEIEAAVDEAAKYGKRVHAHAHSRDGVKACARAGVLSMHSGEYVDEEGLVLLREHGVILSPTIAWLHARCLPEYFLADDPEFVRQAWDSFVAAADAMRAAREMGVKVAIGTDASHRFFHVPDAVLEMQFFQELGYTPLEVIEAATRTAAEAIDRGDVLGTLEPGKLGDVLVVDGDPTEDVGLLRDKSLIAWQIIGGRRIELAEDRGVLGDERFSVRDALAQAESGAPDGARVG